MTNIKHKGLALAVLAAAQFMVVLDATIVNVALPSIQSALGFASATELQWIVTAYALTFGGFLLLGGRLADLYGRRKFFLIGTMLFALASLLAGLAQTPEQLIALRGLQGLGGALLAPAALSLVITIFKEGPERHRALGIWGMIAAGGAAVGLLLGGLLTQYIDWRWIFFINIPVAVIIIAAALKYVPLAKPESRVKLDVLGAISITLSLIALVYGLSITPDKGWGSFEVLSMLALSVVLGVAFVVNELKTSSPLIPLGVFKRRNVTGSTLINILMPASMFGMFFYLSIYQQQILGFSPIQTGLANLPFTITVIVIAAILSKRMAKLNAKLILTIAPFVVAVGLLFFARVPIDAAYPVDILPGIIMMAAGMAAIFVVNTVVATNGVSHQESGLVSGLLNTGQQVGGAIGLAVLTVVSTNATKNHLAASGSDPAAMTTALVHGFHHGFIAAILFVLGAGVVAATVLKITKPSEQDIENLPDREAEALPAIPGA